MRRVYRRVLVLRANGQHDAAATLEHTELAHALAAARLATEDATLEPRVLAGEAERVAQAQTLAELLAPLLAQRLRPELPGPPRPSSAVSAPDAPAPVITAAPARSPAGEVPPIADLIESMLSQQSPRGPRRS